MGNIVNDHTFRDITGGKPLWAFEKAREKLFQGRRSENDIVGAHKVRLLISLFVWLT